MKIFELFGDILINDKGSNEIDKVTEKGKILGININENITKFAGFAAAGATAAVAVGAAMMKLATDASDVASRINDMSAKMGISTTGFQEWDYVLKQSGVDIGVLQGGMKTLNNVIDAASDSTSTQAEMFKRLGISLTDNQGKLKDTETIFNEVVTALQGMPEGANKAALANDLLGKSSTEMSAIINGTSENLIDMKNRAHELGLVMSEEAVAAGDDFGDTLEDVKMSMGAVGREVGTALMPPLKGFLDFILNSAIPAVKKWWEDTTYGFKQVQLIAVNVASSILGTFQNLTNGIDAVWVGIVEKTLNALNGLMSMLGGWIDNLNKTFGTNFAKPNFEQFGKNIIEGMKAGAESDLDRTVSILKDAFDITAKEIESSMTTSSTKTATSIKKDAGDTTNVILDYAKTIGTAAKETADKITFISFTAAQEAKKYSENGIAEINRMLQANKNYVDNSKEYYTDMTQFIATAMSNNADKIVSLQDEKSEAMKQSEKEYSQYVANINKEYKDSVLALNAVQVASDTETTKAKMENLRNYVGAAQEGFSSVMRIGISVDEKMETLIKNLKDGNVNLSTWINTYNKMSMKERDAYHKLVDEGKMPTISNINGYWDGKYEYSGSTHVQNITINSPTPLSASDIARENKNVSRGYIR